MIQLLGLLGFVVVGLAVIWGNAYYELYGQYQQEIRTFLREQYCQTNPPPQVDGFWDQCDPNDVENLRNHGYDFEIENAMMNMSAEEFAAATGLNPYPQAP